MDFIEDVFNNTISIIYALCICKKHNIIKCIQNVIQNVLETVVSLFELPCKNDTWYELPNFFIGLFCTFMHDFSSRRNRHVVLFDCQHRLHILVHHSVSILLLQLFQHYILLPYKCAVVRQF